MTTYAPHKLTCPCCGASWHLTAEEVESMHECGASAFLVDSALCDACEEKAKAMELRQREETRRTAFLAGIPEEYRKATAERVPECYAGVKTGSPLRMGLIGPSGSGKSCAMAVHIMQRRQSFLWLTSNEVREITTEAAKKGGEWTMKLERMRKVAVLVIDDLSQVKFTDTFSGELYQLLEFRNKHRLAVLWTSQKDLGALRIKIAEQVYRDKYQAAPTHPNQLDTDQAFAITRRLGQDATKLISP